jgi:hypothetical protein
MDSLKFKSAQLSLFIIIGIVLVSAIVLLFTFYGPEISLPGQKMGSPVERISLCIEDTILEYEKSFFEKPINIGTNLSYTSNRETMPFLCYSTEYYMPCVPQSPLFIESVRKNMENSVSRELSRCILSVKEDYEKRGYSFENSDFEFSIVFNELDFFYSVEMNIRLEKDEEVILISSREGTVPSILPKILRTAETIVNYETTFCEFNYMTWQAVNRNIIINRFRGGDQTKVYILKDRLSNKEIKFAIRTCVMPAGI